MFNTGFDQGFDEQKHVSWTAARYRRDGINGGIVFNPDHFPNGFQQLLRNGFIAFIHLFKGHQAGNATADKGRGIGHAADHTLVRLAGFAQPVTKAGFEKTKDSDFYAKNVGADVAVKQLDASTTENSRGIRLGSLPQIRDIEDGVMEQIFAGKVTPEEGLKAMQGRGNELLERFEKSVK